jgi:hypothetical protein
VNLSVIERMLRETDLSADARYLLHCRSECEWLDYKQDLHLDSNKDLCDFTRDIIGMKNVGGGYIIVGVRDKTWEPIGINAPLPYDNKMLRDKIRKSSGLDLDVYIVHHQIDTSGGKKLFALISIRSTGKRHKHRAPTVVMKDFCTNEHYCMRRGEIYVRRGDSTCKIQSQSELTDLLDILESQADEDALMSSAHSSPFAVKDGLYRLLEKGYETFVGRTSLRNTVMESVTRDPRIWIINVHGPGGVGKSAVVNWATYEFYNQRKFEAIIQLSAKETVLSEHGIKPYSRSLYSIDDLLDHILNVFEESIPVDFDAKKIMAIELLSAWSTLLVLDNMETVSDGRIMSFLQSLGRVNFLV